MADAKRTRSKRPDAACRRACSVDGCPNVVGTAGARGLCPTHYSRYKRTGDVGPAESMQVSRQGVCTTDGCIDPIQSRGLCRTHYVRLRQRGTVSVVCLYCGADMTNVSRARKFCSRGHAAMYRRHDGARPMGRACTRCGGTFDLTVVGRAGRTKRADAKMCPECRRGRRTRHGWSVSAIVAIHGTTACGICGEQVDLSLRKPDLMRASIDHIVPYAHGGSNDPENLQLAHLHCNHVKSDSGWARGKRTPVK